LNFKANHPDWVASADGEKYLQNLDKILSSSLLANSDPTGAIPMNIGPMKSSNTVTSRVNMNTLRSSDPSRRLFHSDNSEIENLNGIGLSNSKISMQESIADLEKIHKLFYNGELKDSARV